MILTLNMQESGNVCLSCLAAMRHLKYYQTLTANFILWLTIIWQRIAFN